MINEDDVGFGHSDRSGSLYQLCASINLSGRTGFNNCKLYISWAIRYIAFVGETLAHSTNGFLVV